jgi:hypothetical protein
LFADETIDLQATNKIITLPINYIANETFFGGSAAIITDDITLSEISCNSAQCAMETVIFIATDAGK